LNNMGGAGRADTIRCRHCCALAFESNLNGARTFD